MTEHGREAPETERFRLEGRVALLTGAAGHFGAAMAPALNGAGAHVVLGGRSADKLEALRQTLPDPERATVVPFDVGDPEACRAVIERIGGGLGRLDVIVNNAYSGRAVPLEDAEADDFVRGYQVAVAGPFQLVRFALPLLKEAGARHRGGASIVNVGSMYGSVSPDPRVYGESGMNNPPFYGAAKAGLHQLTRYLACHLAPWNVRVNCIAPGPFPPERVGEDHPEFAAALRGKVPLGRLGRPAELVGPLLFLASDASSYVTGAVLPVDGGWTAW
jgi:NAD(P)-dependent dehydrogenase (short-subunit alcohol dehydrogenase family)